MGTDTLESKPSSNSLESLTPTLVLRLQSHDAEAGALLDRLYRDALYRFCWGYLGRGDEAEDAVQDICFKVLRTTDVPENFRPWLYRVARNHCLNLLRARGRRKDGRPLPAPSELQAALTGQLTKLVNQEQKARLGELVEHLSDAHREVLRL
ncbi:MAG: RNA polymerase sigma factor, partial [Planctomycetes bacterium]|nr:RNA polymerase sigma factor [Planctomycetota bacterium]